MTITSSSLFVEEIVAKNTAGHAAMIEHSESRGEETENLSSESPTIQPVDAVWPTLPMPDLRCDIGGVKHFTWTIDDWANRRNPAFSPQFRCHGSTWQLMLSAQSKEGRDDELFTLTLKHISPSDTCDSNDRWPVYTQYRLLISNYEDPWIHKSFYRRARFDNNDKERQKDTRPFTLSRPDPLYDQSRQKSSGENANITSNNSVDISIWLRVLAKKSVEENLERISKVLKQPSPKRGLTQGASRRYLNVYLQFINSVPNLRRIMFRLPPLFLVPESRNVSQALKQVFCGLEVSKAKLVDASQVITSFPWNTMVSHMDFQDRQLTPRLKAFIKAFDTYISNQIKDVTSDKITLPYENLFNVTTRTFMSQPDSDYTSVRFHQVSALTITLTYDQPYPAIPRSLIDYLRDYGSTRQSSDSPSRRTTTFMSFPPILRIAVEVPLDGNQTKRSPPALDYPHTLNLTGLLDEQSPIQSNQQWIYNLHAIIVRGSDARRDFYFTLLRPSPFLTDEEEIWTKFEDAHVTKHHIPWTDSIMDIEETAVGFDSDLLKGIKSPCMLIYIHSEMEEKLFEDKKHIEEWLARSVWESTHSGNYSLTSTAISTTTSTTPRVTDTTFRIQIVKDSIYAIHTGFGYASFSQNSKDCPNSQAITFIPSENETLTSIRQRVWFPDNEMRHGVRLWSLSARQAPSDVAGSDVRLNWPFTQQAEQTVKSLQQTMRPGEMALRFYIQIMPTTDTPNKIFLFLKSFNKHTRKFTTLGTCHLPKNSPISALVNIFSQRLNLPLTSPSVALYKEISVGKARLLKNLAYWMDVLDGDIVFCVVGQFGSRPLEERQVGRLVYGPIRGEEIEINTDS